MDDSRIQQLTSEVIAALEGREEAGATGPLEARIAALEAEVAELKRRLAGGVAASAPAAAPTTVAVSVHPSFQVLNLGASPARCVLEPDKPCAESGQCKSLGH